VLLSSELRHSWDGVPVLCIIGSPCRDRTVKCGTSAQLFGYAIFPVINTKPTSRSFQLRYEHNLKRQHDSTTLGTRQNTSRHRHPQIPIQSPASHLQTDLGGLPPRLAANIRHIRLPDLHCPTGMAQDARSVVLRLRTTRQSELLASQSESTQTINQNDCYPRCHISSLGGLFWLDASEFAYSRMEFCYRLGVLGLCDVCVV
jgi:hypothetical protein